MGQGLGAVWLGVLDQGLTSEGSGGAGGPISKVTLSHGWQVEAGCWQEASVTFHVGLTTEPLECPHNMAAPPFPPPSPASMIEKRRAEAMPFVT